MSSVKAERGDITQLGVDVIVNAANRWLNGGGGVDGAIHRAGGSTIIRECMEITARRGQIQPGQVVATGAGELRATHVLHAVGPIWDAANPTAADTALASCYRNSLTLAAELGARSIAFPSISTGVYGFPVDRAATIAVSTVESWLAESPDVLDEVVFVCFDAGALDVYRPLIRRLTAARDIDSSRPVAGSSESDASVSRGAPWWSRIRVKRSR